jgi:hypothetical protein
LFIINDGKPTGSPATNQNRIAMLGILVGLAFATPTGIAVFRRLP